jgi:hypothetical protein
VRRIAAGTAWMAVLLVATACHRGAPVAADFATGPTAIPRDAARFSITSSNDTTVVFRPLEAKWVRAGMRAHAVDPLQRDAIIARLTILHVDTANVVARITGQVSPVSVNHVVLVVRPRVAWWHDLHFWLGAGAGAALGAVAVAMR